MSTVNLDNSDMMINRATKFLLMAGWFDVFVSYPMRESDNQVVKYLVISTMILLTLCFVISFIIALLKYKGSFLELIGKMSSGAWNMINIVLLIAVLVLSNYLYSNAYVEILAYSALTIFVINCVVFAFEDCRDNKSGICG